MNPRQRPDIEQRTGALHCMLTMNVKRELVAFMCERQPLLTFWSSGIPARCPVCRLKNPLGESVMIICKDSRGNVIGYQETYFSQNENVTVNTVGRLIATTTTGRGTGKVEIKTTFGRPDLPSGDSK
jgi:hypothetical protein